jgi:hypothetical protein
VNFLCQKWLWYLAVGVSTHIDVQAANQNHQFVSQNHQFASQSHLVVQAVAALPLNDFAGIFISANQQ